MIDLTRAVDLSSEESIELWRVTNDGVMGGLSEGCMLFDHDHGVFSGHISLENNGGFSSVFRPVKGVPKKLHSIQIDVEGDGKCYQLRAVVFDNGYCLAYKQDFETIVGQRQVFTFPLTDFKASFRGRLISNAPILASSDVREVGLLVNNHEAGEFALSVFRIEFLES
ncbi:CIA30 family protein [Moritella sp. F3]|uniref:CIA30 family protein n=1 Tax=Moritella sp. F3 TaxID=2718882 RepID=UPI0018E17308|nr:CIA30 family protein [Moritella sp. F3]GIC77023.1 exonuclease [Moritella sp. F1]GIC80205.1 exonuclease [Moritella sp. F3]